MRRCHHPSLDLAASGYIRFSFDWPAIKIPEPPLFTISMGPLCGDCRNKPNNISLEIPSSFIAAVIAIEDGVYSHHGVDFTGILRVYTNIRQGKVARAVLSPNKLLRIYSSPMSVY